MAGSSILQGITYSVGTDADGGSLSSNDITGVHSTPTAPNTHLTIAKRYKSGLQCLVFTSTFILRFICYYKEKKHW